jgi:hypothetical protein
MKRRTLFILTVVAAIGLMTAWFVYASAIVQPVQQLAPLAQLGGTAQAVAVDGDVAFVVMGPRIFSLDVSHPDAPVKLAETPPLPQRIEHLHLDSGRVYAFAGETLLVFQRTQANHLRFLAEIALPESPLTVHNNVLYMADNWRNHLADRLIFWDVSNPQSPTPIGGYENGYYFTAISVDGNRMAALCWERRNGQAERKRLLLLLDISNPASPQLISSTPLTSTNRPQYELLLEKDRLFLLGDPGLTTFDISNELAPVPRGGMETFADRIIGADAHTLYLAHRYKETLLVVDIQDLTHPTLRSELEIAGAIDFDLGNDWIFTASQAGGLQSVAVIDKDHPEIVGRYVNALSAPVGLAAVHDIVYALDQKAIVVIDASDPRQPVILSRYPLPEPGVSILFHQDRLYVGAGNFLHILDVSTPAHPTEIRRVEMEASIKNIMALHDRIYMVASYYSRGGFYAMDAEGAPPPQLLIPKRGGSVYVVDEGNRQLAYFTSATTFSIYDITNETSVVQLSNLSLERLASYNADRTDLVVRDHLAYLYTGEIIDVSDPTAPFLLSRQEFPNSVNPPYPFKVGVQIDLWGDHLYLNRSMISVSQPDQPYLAGQYPLRLYGNAVQVTDRAVFVTDVKSGLWLLQYTPPSVFSWRKEAEDADVSAPMIIQKDARACGGRYVVSQQKWSPGGVAFHADVPADGNYYLWARAAGQDWHQNSFRVSIDGGEPFQYEIRPPDGRWHWGAVHPEGRRVEPFGLTAGSHTIRFLSREANSRLDAIVLFNHPDLTPDDAQPCIAPATPSPTPTPTATPTLPAPTPAPPPVPEDSGLRFAGQFGGNPLFGVGSQPIAAWGDLLFVGDGDKLRTIDVSCSEHFETIDTLPDFPGPITSLAAQEPYVFAQANGLTVIDVHNAHDPKVVARPSGLPGAIHVTGNRAYLTDENIWTIVDIAQPATPRIIGRVQGVSAEVQFEHERAYVQENPDLIAIYDLSDPTVLQKMGVYTLPTGHFTSNSINAMQIHGDMLYLLSYSRDAYTGLASIAKILGVDVSDPTHPRLRATFEQEGWDRGNSYGFHALAIQGNALILGMNKSITPYCCYTITSYYLQKFDISDPDQIQWVQEKQAPHRTSPQIATETRIYAKTYLHDPSLPSIYLSAFQFDALTSCPPAGLITGKKISGSQQEAFLWDGGDLWFIDNSAPDSPRATGVYTKSSAYIHLENTHAYVGSHHGPPDQDYMNRMCIADLTLGPEAPCHSLPLDVFVNTRVLSESGGFTFLQIENYRSAWQVGVYDVRNLEDIREEAVVELTPVDVKALNCCQEQPYAAWAMNIDPYTHYLLISPLDRPDAPVGRLDMDSPIRKIGVSGDILVLLTDKDLRLVDVSALNNPHEVGRYAFAGAQGEARTLKVVDGRAYAGIGRQLRVVDITKPVRPTETRIFNAPDDILDIHIEASIISLAVAEAGMINLLKFDATSIYLPQIFH